MILKKFFCASLNHFINLEIGFHDDVTFLHGINGSGKTSVLKAIASLLTPDPIWLANSPFDIIRIEFDQDGQHYKISASKLNNGKIDILLEGSQIISGSLEEQEIAFVSRQTTDEHYRYSHIETDESYTFVQRYIEKNQVLSHIAKLPAPIFLGLDRTTLTPYDAASASSSRPWLSANRPRVVHPYFRTQLDDAVWEAEKLLVQELSKVSAARNKIFEELRNEFVLSLFRVPEPRSNKSWLDVQDLVRPVPYKQMLASITEAFRKINVSEQDISQEIVPFFSETERLQQAAAASMRRYEQRRKKKLPIEDTFFDPVRRYYDRVPYISIIEGTLKKIEASNAKEKAASAALDNYKKIIDEFLSDSRKSLIFTENAVNVRLPSGDISSITALSSGERQLFVLLTHLSFNPQMRGANILLIDEPELSLHLKWQRQFVPAIRKASPSTQMVLATHSPEIIFDRVDRLVPLSK